VDEEIEIAAMVEEEEEEEIEWGIERVKWREKSGFVMLSVECVCVLCGWRNEWEPLLINSIVLSLLLESLAAPSPLTT
jgi:hypothetical protein